MRLSARGRCCASALVAWFHFGARCWSAGAACPLSVCLISWRGRSWVRSARAAFHLSEYGRALRLSRCRAWWRASPGGVGCNYVGRCSALCACGRSRRICRAALGVVLARRGCFCGSGCLLFGWARWCGSVGVRRRRLGWLCLRARLRARCRRCRGRPLRSGRRPFSAWCVLRARAGVPDLRRGAGRGLLVRYAIKHMFFYSVRADRSRAGLLLLTCCGWACEGAALPPFIDNRRGAVPTPKYYYNRFLRGWSRWYNLSVFRDCRYNAIIARFHKDNMYLLSWFQLPFMRAAGRASLAVLAALCGAPGLRGIYLCGRGLPWLCVRSRACWRLWALLIGCGCSAGARAVCCVALARVALLRLPLSRSWCALFGLLGLWVV